ncbi:MAG: ELM1/GtrOC1 family putative glycosyltransferase [Gammaproteobacteria bacterium]
MFVIPAHVRATFSSSKNKCRDASGMRSQPERVVLGVADGVAPSPKPPVRIFLGTEPAQYRAERIFIWSIERVRDPSRIYEIYLMKELAGFDRRRWLTGFTNYRFAIPHFAGGSGRAIWNDVDQAYLSDPGELFDTDMGDAAVLTVPPLSSSSLLDTAVMLIDCARMASIWTLDAARHGRKNTLLAKLRAVPGLRGDLDSAWHARDEEYVPGRSKLLHWTILHTQPWRPLPQLFVYQRNPVGHVWFDLERSANLDGYHVFSADRPSSEYTALLTRLRTSRRDNNQSTLRVPHHAATRQNPAGLRDLITRIKPKTILEYRFAGVEEFHHALDSIDTENDGPAVSRYDPAYASRTERPSGRYDGVVCDEALDYIPDGDVPWVIEDLFSWARQFVYVAVSTYPRTKVLPDGTRLQSRSRDRAWWNTQIESVTAHHPDVHWELVFGAPGSANRKPVYRRMGNHRLDEMPATWVLSDDRPENITQSVALAEALGAPYEIKKFRTKTELSPPWPDLVITAGSRSASVAYAIRNQSEGYTRLVQLNGGMLDAAVTPAYYRLPPHPQRIETVTPLTQVTPERLSRARQRWPHLFGETPRPCVVLLVGGTTLQYRLDPRTARRMGNDVRTFCQLSGGSIFTLISRRAEPQTIGALVTGLGEPCHLHSWLPGDLIDGPYLAYLELADVIVVTGHSEILLADAAATGKPVYIYPVPERRPKLKQRLKEAVLTRSQARPLNKRGTVRPQQGLEYLCARLIDRRIVVPPHDLTLLHQNLIRLGIAHPFYPTLEPGTDRTPGLREADDAACRVRNLLGLAPAIGTC